MAAKHRAVFLAPDLAKAREAVTVAVAAGIPDTDVHLIARPDIEVGRVQDRRKIADRDIVPAAMRGIAIGAVIGLLISAALMMLGIATTGMWWLFGVGIGGAVGGLGAALSGAAVSDPIRRHFQRQITAGNVLVVVDAEEEDLARLRPVMEDAGAPRQAYDASVALS